MLEKIIQSLNLDSLNFVSSIKVIESGNVVEYIDFAESNELKLIKENTTKKRGRPKLTERQKAFLQFKRAAGKTKKFTVGEEQNRRSHLN